jgi:hypothetical protein
VPPTMEAPFADLQRCALHFPVRLVPTTACHLGKSFQ